MIKLDISNLDKIAESYFWQIKQKDRRKTDNIRRYYIEHLRDFVLCDLSEMEAKSREFRTLFAAEINEAERCYQEFEVYKNNDANKANITLYRSTCKALKEAWENTLYCKFRFYMENQYNTCFQELIKYNLADKSTYNNQDKIGVWLAKRLDVKTCPYCNRIYTFTVCSKDRSIRPEFDHFYPKSEYPYFALSFFNLVPSCPICNHVKGITFIDYHPYIEGFDDKFKFYIDEEELRKREIREIKFTNDTNRNIDCFLLKDLYNEHLDYINEIVYKQAAYTDDNIQNIMDSFQGMGIKDDIYSYIWGCYQDTALHIKRPLSKLTKDILDQIKSLD